MSSQTRDVKNFSKIELLGAGEIHLTQGDEYSLVIEAEDEILDYLTSELRGETLVLDIEKGRSINTEDPIYYHITTPKIEVVKIAGGGKLVAQKITGNSFLLDVPGAAEVEIGSIEVNACRLDVRGAVNMRLNKLAAQGISFDVKGTLKLTTALVKTEALTSNVEGTCNVSLAGEARVQIIHAPGVINYQAGTLQCSQATINAQGMANLTLWVEDNLNIRLQGVGNVRYYGRPERSVKINGLASVQNIGDKPKIINYA